MSTINNNFFCVFLNTEFQSHVFLSPVVITGFVEMAVALMVDLLRMLASSLANVVTLLVPWIDILVR